MLFSHIIDGVRRALHSKRVDSEQLALPVYPKSPGGKANIEERGRVMRHGRIAAEQAVGDALTEAENDAPTEPQVDDLSDAVDALSDRTYGGAVESAEKGTRKLRPSTHDHSDRLEYLRSKFNGLLKRPFPKEK